MRESIEERAFERVAEVRFKGLRADLSELKERVSGLEEKLNRGVMLLVANLAGIAAMLLREVIGR